MKLLYKFALWRRYGWCRVTNTLYKWLTSITVIGDTFLCLGASVGGWNTNKKQWFDYHWIAWIYLTGMGANLHVYQNVCLGDSIYDGFTTRLHYEDPSIRFSTAPPPNYQENQTKTLANSLQLLQVLAYFMTKQHRWLSNTCRMFWYEHLVSINKIHLK